MTEQMFNPELFTLAREYRGLTQTELAAKTPYAQSIISRFESGSLRISEENARTLANALEFPVEFFQQTEKVYGLGASFLFHRKRQTMPVGELRRIEAEINVVKIAISRMLRGIEMQHEHAFTPMEVGLEGTPEQIAQLVRAGWKLPSGPISNLSSAIESAGGIIVRCPFSNRKVDGISMWVTGMPPLFFLNENSPGDRDRWTLAHELGHIIMHRVPTPSIEEEADRFASELLMPQKIIRPELQSMTLARAASMKLKWRVSIAAIIRRAKDLGTITPSQYRYLCMEMSKAGWRTREPNALPPEKGVNLQSLVAVHQNDHGYSIEDMSRIALLNPNEFRQRFVPPEGPRLRLVN
jgi:Zn-dependent peptidase ImmA (M78 family)/transcriptional regulator with XRE-family HTH domain